MTHFDRYSTDFGEVRSPKFVQSPSCHGFLLKETKKIESREDDRQLIKEDEWLMEKKEEMISIKNPTRIPPNPETQPAQKSYHINQTQIHFK